MLPVRWFGIKKAMLPSHNATHMTTIALIAALPEEINPFLARVGTSRKDRIAGFPLYHCRIGDRELILLQSGMGPKNAESATRALLDTTTPDLIINFGLGGAVAPGPRIAEKRRLCKETPNSLSSAICGTPQSRARRASHLWQPRGSLFYVNLYLYDSLCIPRRRVRERLIQTAQRGNAVVK